jgi:hypothetical protein
LGTLELVVLVFKCNRRKSFMFIKSRIVQVCSVALALVSVYAVAQTLPVRTGGTASFYKSIVGSWVGTCVQSTDGKRADDKYFRADIKQVNANTYTGLFSYYRLNKQTGVLAPIGTSTLTTTIDAAGNARSTIVGTGSVITDGNVNNAKPESHTLQEMQSMINASSIRGVGTGNISVKGMPFNAGKNGKVQNRTTTWSMANNSLSIDQTLNVKFKALIFSKSFSINAKYTAVRGTDVASLLKNVPVARR